jgi:nuclear cap-binding protein subunit 2
MVLQNKKRKYGRDRDEDRERTPEPEEDPLKDATTLYVGNL